MKVLSSLVLAALSCACQHAPIAARDGEAADGVRRIEIDTPKGKFKVWTRRTGDNPRIKVLLLHGGPALTHEYLAAFDDVFPGAGIEYYQYDQLGSYHSDQPEDDSLWEIPRFVDEVEQVRKALGLDRDDFYLYGHSWGGILAIEYALVYPQHLKGLIVSDMMASIPKYDEYAERVLMPPMDQAALAEIKQLEASSDTANPRYMELLMEHHYSKHILRRPPEEWPAGVMASLEHVNPSIYVLMQGPSELGTSGRLEHWDRTADLGRIRVPTLVIGARYDTMDPEHMRWMASAFPRGRFLYCADGSHLCMYDDAKTYFDGLLDFLRDVDRGVF
jgi:proline iminopeptidase